MNELEKDIDELLNTIKESPLYQKYLTINNQMENNQDINQLVNDIKNLQKKAVHEESQHQDNNVKQLDKIIDDKIIALNNIPLYQEYKDVAEEVNQMLNSISNKMQQCIDNINM